jgi:putative NADH-flavin reductase
MRLAIFGATGTVGSELLTQALQSDHDVRALVREPSKLPAHHAQAVVVHGDVRDLAAVGETVRGCAAVLSTLGATGRRDPDVRRVGTANLLAAMQEHGLRRLVVMGGFHLRFPGDPNNLGRKLILPFLRLISAHLIEDTIAMGSLIQASDVEWTVVRAPRVAPGTRPALARTGTLELGPWSKVTRANVASFMLRCLADETHIRQAPMICDRSHAASGLEVLASKRVARNAFSQHEHRRTW